MKIKQGNLLKLLPKPLLDSLVTGDVIPFIGAGFSKNCEGPIGSSMPDWNALGKAIASEMPGYEFDGNPIDALSAYEGRYRRSTLVETLRRVLQADVIRPGTAHQLLVNSFRGVICTTNFDTLIEVAFVEKGMNPIVVTSEDGLPTLKANAASIIKIHGDLNHPERLVVTESDYDSFISKNPLLCTYISSLFITKTMLLVGYSLDDSDLRQLLRIVQDRLGVMSRPIYSIQVGAKKDMIARFKRRGVDVINLPMSRDKSYKEIITEFLQQLKAYLDDVSQRRVTSSIEDAKAQLMLNSEENKLCFVVCAKSHIAFLRESLDSHIMESGATPLWPDNILETGGIGYRRAIDAAIEKSHVRIFDVSDMDENLVPALQDSLRTSGERTFLIKNVNSDNLQYDSLLGSKLFKYGVSADNGELKWVPGDFPEELKNILTSLLGKQSNERLSRAKRLLKIGEYDAAIVSAWTELESFIRGKDPCVTNRAFIESLYKHANGDHALKSNITNVRRMRNEVVHGVRKARVAEAKLAITVVDTLMSK
ncbi:MAG: SIR2 family protein [Kiritimatiellae bacterium]|nr:SIR2 family protein [Kiritimatiellia bacterium]